MTWLIYDSDGVLVDSELLAGAALAELMSRLGHPITGTECIRVFGRLNVGDALASLPYRRCVCSSSAPDRLRLSLEVTGLAPLFGNNVYSAAQVPHGKPAPDLFLFAARASPEAALCV